MVFKEIGGFLGIRSRGRRRLTPTGVDQEGVKPITIFERPEYLDLVEVSEKILDMLRLEHLVEGPQRGLVDFDLVEKDSISERIEENLIKWIQNNPGKKVRQEFATSLDELGQEVANLPGLGDEDEDEDAADQQEFLLLKVKALSTYNAVKAGKQIPFNDYIELTQGVIPEEISEEKLGDQVDVVKRLCARLKIDFSKEAIQDFRKSQEIPFEQVPDLMRETAEALLPYLEEFLGTTISPIPYRIEQEDPPKDEYWFNWSSGRYNDFELLINPHERHAHKFTRGKVEAMASHEILGHLAQMTLWQRGIESKKLLRGLGETSVNDPEQITNEGIAETLHRFVPGIINNLSRAALFELEIEGLRQMAYNNVHIRMNSDQPHSRKGAHDYVTRFVPTETMAEVTRQMTERTKDDSRRSYLYAYGVGFLRHKEYAQMLNVEGRRQLLRLIYSRPITPQQEQDFVEKLLADPDGKYSSQAA